MRFRTTAILLAVAVLVGGYILLFERGATLDESATSDDALRPAVLGFDVALAREVEIERPATGERTRLAYRPAEELWYVAEPRQEPADQLDVEQFVGMLSWVQSVRELTGELDAPDAYGLEPPETRIRVVLSGGEELVLEVGFETPTGGGRYARVVGSETLLVIPSYAAEDAEGHLSSPPYRPTPTPEPTATPAEGEGPAGD